ncbi:MAG: SurA N-terminal domain-containing protein [Pyrinomonadaceae bacterium]
MVYFEGVIVNVRKAKFKVSVIALLALLTAFIFSACSSMTTAPSGNPSDTAATVNGKAINMEDVERVIKQQGQGQEAKLSPLELAQARLQVLDGLIQQEVMYQKAEKEGVVPKDEDVTAEFNKTKQTSGLSQEKFDEEMKKAGETEASARETIKKQLAIKALIDKITSKVEPAKDSEVAESFKGNPDFFTKKRGAKLAAIVVDPSNSGEGDTTTDAASAAQKIKEIAAQLNQGADFATVARENSEDQSRIQGGDLGYFTEDMLRQTFGDQIAAGFMNPQTPNGKVVGPFNIQGKYYIIKLQERIDKDEAQTLESPGVRQSIVDSLLDARKRLVAASYQSMAMDEAKIENFLAKRIVGNPNELSGARPANANAAPNVNTAAPNMNAPGNVNSNINVNAKPVANTKPSANSNAKPPVAPPANTNGKK